MSGKIIDSPVEELFVEVDDFEKEARKKLSQENFIYFKLGVDEELTVEENIAAYKRWRFRPRLLQDVSKVDTSVEIMGSEIPFPICIAPTALHRMAHEGGEVLTAKGGETVGVGFTHSIFSHCSLEEVAENVPNCIRWCHVQIIRNRDFLTHYIRRAEKAGYSGFIVTLDQPILGKKRRRTSDGISYPHQERHTSTNLYQTTKHWFSHPPNEANYAFAGEFDGKVTWKDLQWMTTITKLPVVAKGILTAEMATEALNHGVSAIIVSNHGGRQIDSVFSTIDTLPEVVKAVNGRCDVYLDGGIRRGSDVAKAIALGAKAVFVGRPIIWGLATGGEQGVAKVLKLLRDELVSTMKLIGVSSLKELRETPQLVVHENWKFANL